MSVLKVKNDNGVWQDIATANSHAHTVSDISDLPASLVDDVEALKDKVGADSVAYQITTAVQASAYQHPYTHPADMITGLSDVAISGSYEDLKDKPEQTQSDWNQTDDTAVDYIKNKPIIPEEYTHPETHPASMIEGLATVATSGNYNDLSNKPVIPSIAGLATKTYVDEQIASVGGSCGMTEQVQADWDETDTTSPAYIKNKPTISGEGGASVQANWNQTDESQADYIKNKPFGEYEGLVDILPLTQYNDFYFDSTYGVHMKDVEATYSLTIGETYTVFWDDNEYSCVAQDADTVMSGTIVIGNCASFGLSGNNEPFIIGILPHGYAVYMALADQEAGGSHTVQIVQWGEIVNQIDKKYIPIPYFGEGGTKQTELVPTTDLTFSYYTDEGAYIHTFTPSTEQLSVWQSDWTTVDIVLDGTTYTCEPQNINGIKCVGNVDFMMGAGDNGMPFVLMMADAAMFGQDTCIIYSLSDIPEDVNNTPDITHNMSVLTNTTDIVTIDPKYIENVSWDKITDKPFETIASGTVVLNEDVIANDDMVFLQNLAHEYMIAGKHYTITVGDYVYNAICEENNAQKGIYVSDNGDEIIVIVYLSGVGVCILNTNTFSSGSTYNVKVVVAEDIVKTIDPKFIPKIDGLPEVTANDNGKSLKVIDGVWSISDSLPSVTVEDVGKFLRVGSDGTWVVETIQNVSEVGL